MAVTRNGSAGLDGFCGQLQGGGARGGRLVDGPCIKLLAFLRQVPIGWNASDLDRQDLPCFNPDRQGDRQRLRSSAHEGLHLIKLRVSGGQHAVCHRLGVPVPSEVCQHRQAGAHGAARDTQKNRRSPLRHTRAQEAKQGHVDVGPLLPTVRREGPVGERPSTRLALVAHQRQPRSLGRECPSPPKEVAGRVGMVDAARIRAAGRSGRSHMGRIVA